MTLIDFCFPSEYRWYRTNSNDGEKVEGIFRSETSGKVIYPDLQWEYIEVKKCYTYEWNFQTRKDDIPTNTSCVFPFTLDGDKKLYGCYRIFASQDGQVF